MKQAAGVIAAAIGVAALPAPALAQMAPTSAPGPAAAPATPLDPARVAAARELIDLLLPPATREQLLAGMMTPMLANMRRAMADAPGFTDAIDGNPRLRALFDRFMADQEVEVMQTLREALPAMPPAMANAYARRFDLKQLRELRAFFETPTGRAYMQASYTIMSDPDVAAWQRDMTTRSMARMQANVAKFVEQAAKVEKP